MNASVRCKWFLNMLLMIIWVQKIDIKFLISVLVSLKIRSILTLEKVDAFSWVIL